jgi:hypothetical protein
MAQYVIEFGSENIGPVAHSIQQCLDRPYELVACDLHHELAPGEVRGSLADILKGLESGHLGSVTLRNGDARIRYALITSPRLDGCTLNLWIGTIEVGVEDWRFVWDQLLLHDGLKFVCVGAEEGVELTDGQITAETFPWSEWPLVVGAVKTPDGEWVIRYRLPQ